MPLSLRWHLLGLVLAAVLPVLIFSAAIMNQLGENQRRTAESEIVSAASALAEDVDVELQSWISALEILAASNPLMDSDLLSFYYLAQRVRQSQKWANVVLTGPNGEHLMNLRAPYGSRLPPLNRPDVFINAAKSGGAYVSNVVPGLLAGQNLTVVTLPIFRDDRVEYVIAAALSAPTWESFLRGRLPPRAHGVLLDREGSLISATLGGNSLVGKKVMPPLLDAIKENPERGTLRGRSLQGTESFVAYVRAPLSGWTISVWMPESEIAGPVRASLIQLGLGFVILLALGLGLAWMFARRIGTAIEELTASVRAVGDGFEPLPVRERITEVQQAEAALKDAAALLAERLRREQAARAEVEAADRAKDKFLATLSHELRNPLAPISAALFILDEADDSGERARSARAVIARQLLHLTRLVDDLLDVTRIGSGKVELRREPVSLNEVLRRARDDHAGIAARAGVSLELDLPREDLEVHGDPTRLGQIVGNLLQNSFRFTPEGGRVRLSLERRGNLAEIRVQDNGAGIDPEVVQQLFEPFFQAPKSGARNAGGLGLGLPLVKGLAELHGGSVRAFSAGRGKGAEFVVTLPLRY